MKKILVLTILAIVALLLFGCNVSELRDPAQVTGDFLELIASGEYEQAYEMLTPEAMELITKDEFVQRYQSIFDGLTITGLEWGEITYEETSIYATCSYSAAYATEKYGTITKEFQVELYSTEGNWEIYWTPQWIFPEMDWGGKVYARVIRAERGEIFGSDGAMIAGNVPGITLYGERSKIADLDSFAQSLSPIIDMEVDAIKKCFDLTNAEVVVIKSWRDGELDKTTEELMLAVEGTGVDTESFTVYRTYPFKEAFFHLVGYVGKITEEELEALKGTEREDLYDGDSIIGKTGLEKAYEEELRGTDGYEVYIVNEDGSTTDVIPKVQPVDGADLHLTIDTRDQTAAYDLMELYLGEEQGGSIVQMDPNTGAVQVMVSYPSTDPNVFVTGISAEDYAYLLSDAAYQPLFNRCLQGRFPPGSIVKPFTGILGLEEGVISKNTEFPYTIVNNKWTPDRSDWFYPAITRINNRGDKVDLYNSLIYSDNIFFAWVAMEVGEESFMDYFENTLGWGAEIPFELSVGKAQIKNEKTEFNIKYLADSGYGQGEMLVTPLQAAMLYCSLSNDDGIIYEPYVIQKRCRAEGNEYVCLEEREPEVFMTIEYDSYIKSCVYEALSDVTEVGTARSLKPPYSMAGKTGTAEIGSEKDREIGWLAVYKNEEPRDTTLVVTLDTPEGVSEIKLQIARYLLRDEVATDENEASYMLE